MRKKLVSLNNFKSLLKGDFISIDKRLHHMKFLYFIVVLIIFNISITFESQRMIINISNKEKFINELKLRSITTKSQLVSLTRRSEIEKKVKEVGLFTSVKPNYVIDYEKK